MKRHALIALVTLLIAVLACGGPSPQAATAQAMSEALNATQAALASSGGPENAVETAEAQATALAQSAAATEAVAAATQAIGQAATETAIAPMVSELPQYGVDPAQGRPGWVHPPVTIDLTGYEQYDYATQFSGTVARSFVVTADITWNTFTGLSGCGFAFRADDKGNQYLLIATRGGNGHIVFVTMADNKVKDHKDFYALPLDVNNDATNHLAVVGQGTLFTFYTNGVQAGQVDTNAKTGPTASIRYDAGFVALVALSESGRTVCKFDRGWLWLIN